MKHLLTLIENNPILFFVVSMVMVAIIFTVLESYFEQRKNNKQ